MSADTVIIHDLDFNPENDRQAEVRLTHRARYRAVTRAQDRCHRIGQTKPVQVIKLVTENTVDMDILEIGERKQLLSKAVLEKGSSSTTTASDEGDIAPDDMVRRSLSRWRGVCLTSATRVCLGSDRENLTESVFTIQIIMRRVQTT